MATKHTIKRKDINYYSLEEILAECEPIRNGITKRIWNHIHDVYSDSKREESCLSINLFFYGLGDEYETEYGKKYPTEIGRKFSDTKAEEELRLDLNLIWSRYEKSADFEEFYVRLY